MVGFVLLMIAAVIGLILHKIWKCCKGCHSCLCGCCRCCRGRGDEDQFGESITLHAPLAAQRLIQNSTMISNLDKTLFEDDSAMRFSGKVRELKSVEDAEDEFTQRQKELREERKQHEHELFPFIGNLSDSDSDDDNNSYKTHKAARGQSNKYDLVLVMFDTDLNQEQRVHFKELLNRADGLTSNDRQEQTIGHRYHHRFRSIFYPKKVDDIMEEICGEGNQRMVLAHDAYRKCMKFKKNVSRIMEEMMAHNDKNSIARSKYLLPEFDIKVMPLRYVDS